MEDLLAGTDKDKSPTWRVNSSVSSSSEKINVMNVIFTKIGRIMEDSRSTRIAFEYTFSAYSTTNHDGRFKLVSTSDTFANSSVLFEICWQGIDSDSIVCGGPSVKNSSSPFPLSLSS
ncbi:hypothetical protein LguiA_008410 [Lonicera macranthoides]